MIKDLQDIGRQPPKDFLTEVNVRELIYPLRSHALGSHYTHQHKNVDQMTQLYFTRPLSAFLLSAQPCPVLLSLPLHHSQLQETAFIPFRPCLILCLRARSIELRLAMA